MVLIHDPSVKRDQFYRDYAGQSHFRPLCSKLGSTVRKWVIAVALHCVTQQQNYRHYGKKLFSVLCVNNLLILLYLRNAARCIHIDDNGL